MIAISVLLVIAVVAIWLGCIGFARLPTAYARMHCVTLVTIAGGIPVTIAALIADGLSSRALKIILLEIILAICGAAVAHATGRAIAMREMTEDNT